MKSVFEPSTQTEIRERFDKINTTSKPAWGKMNPAQMLAHCVKALQSHLGEFEPMPPAFIFRLIGPLFRKQAVKPGIFGKNSPTAKEFLISDERTFATEKTLLLDYLNKISKPESIKSDKHVFFGKLSKEEWGQFM